MNCNSLSNIGIYIFSLRHTVLIRNQRIMIRKKVNALHQDQYTPISHLKLYCRWNVEIVLQSRAKINQPVVAAITTIIIGLR